jgi:PAS domain S-box-containing protein
MKSKAKKEQQINDFLKSTNLVNKDREQPRYKTKEVFEALRDNYSALVEQGNVLLLVMDDQFNIEFTSSTICDTLHYTEKALYQESIFSIMAPESHEQMKRAYKKLKNQDGKSYPLKDLILYCVNGYQHFFDGMIINLNQDERVGGYLFYLHNISERRKIENQLKDLNLELDSFVYKASHDLRAPLSSLAGLIYLTENEFPKEARENFELMKNSVQKLDKFIQQLAHYSRNNYVDTQLELIDFKVFVKEIIDGYRHLLNADKIQFEIQDYTKEDLLVDTFRLRVILSNLISNAIKYHFINQDYPFVNIKLETSNAHYLITVEDNGTGISNKYQEKIFEMFTRASNTSDGSGLGLYIVKKALEKLNGKIKLESEEGQGSVFKVSLPIKGFVKRS